MAKALNPFAPEWYTPASDKDEKGEPRPDASRFKLRGLDGNELGYVSPEFTLGEIAGVPTVTGMSGKGVDLALKCGLLDWERFENDKGPVPFNQGNFRLIPHLLRVELAMQIVAASYVGEAEKKT